MQHSQLWAVSREDVEGAQCDVGGVETRGGMGPKLVEADLKTDKRGPCFRERLQDGVGHDDFAVTERERELREVAEREERVRGSEEHVGGLLGQLAEAPEDHSQITQLRRVPCDSGAHGVHILPLKPLEVQVLEVDDQLAQMRRGAPFEEPGGVAVSGVDDVHGDQRAESHELGVVAVKGELDPEMLKCGQRRQYLKGVRIWIPLPGGHARWLVHLEPQVLEVSECLWRDVGEEIAAAADKLEFGEPGGVGQDVFDCKQTVAFPLLAVECIVENHTSQRRGSQESKIFARLGRLQQRDRLQNWEKWTGITQETREIRPALTCESDVLRVRLLQKMTDGGSTIAEACPSFRADGL